MRVGTHQTIAVSGDFAHAGKFKEMLYFTAVLRNSD